MPRSQVRDVHGAQATEQATRPHELKPKSLCLLSLAVDTGEPNRGKRGRWRREKKQGSRGGEDCENTKETSDGNKAGGVTKQPEKVSAVRLS